MSVFFQVSLDMFVFVLILKMAGLFLSVQFWGWNTVVFVCVVRTCDFVSLGHPIL